MIEILKKAIVSRKPIEYEYETEGRAIGKRYGHPHAIFISSTNNVNIDIFKYDGVMTDSNKPLPAWRQYCVKFITNVLILEQEPEFEVAKGYNPISKQYNRVIVKV